MASNNAVHRERILFLSDIDLYKENKIKNSLTRAGRLLQSKQKELLQTNDNLSPYLKSILSTHEILQNLDKNDSLSDLTNKFTVSRQDSGQVFANLRKQNPGFELYAQCGEEPKLQSRLFFNLSFCTKDCVKNCLEKYGPDTVIMTDNKNICVKKTKTGVLSSTFRKGGTSGPFTNEHAEAFCNENIGQGDFYRFNSTGNDWTTMLADMVQLYELTASDHFTFEQFMDIVNLDSVNDMIFRQAINYVASGEEFIMVQWSSRNYEMAFDCPKAMFKSENGIVTHIYLGHPAWASQGGLKRLVLFIGGTYACLLNVCTHMCHPNYSILGVIQMRSIDLPKNLVTLPAYSMALTLKMRMVLLLFSKPSLSTIGFCGWLVL